MADVTITNSDVLPSASAKLDYSSVGGETFSAGAWVYSDDGELFLADADASAVDSTKSVVFGMAVTDCLIIGAPVVVATDGEVDVGSAVSQGAPYALSGTAGKMCDIGDLAANDWVTYLATGVDGNTIKISINSTLILFA